jgi:hypothetical protein
MKPRVTVGTVSGRDARHPPCPQGLTPALRHETAGGWHLPSAWHATPGVCQAAAAGGPTTRGRCLRRRECPATRWLLRWDTRAARPATSRAARRLSQATAGWPGLAGPRGQARRSGRACPGVAPAAHRTGRVEPAAGVARVTRLRATVSCRRVRGLGRAGERSRRTSRPTRGAPGTAAGRFAARFPAHASAWRAGRPAGGGSRLRPHGRAEQPPRVRRRGRGGPPWGARPERPAMPAPPGAGGWCRPVG